MAEIYHKRGDTLLLTNVWRDSAGNPVNLTPYTITSQIRATNFVQDLVVVKTNAAGGVFTCSLSAALSANLPLTTSNASRLFWDVEFNDAGVVVSSETVQIVVVEDITQ